jgi:type IV secretion system protein TrbL
MTTTVPLPPPVTRADVHRAARRAVVCAVIASVLPTAAAASSTGIARSAYERLRNWLIAWVLYKPTAAIILANGFISVQDPASHPLADAWRSLALMGPAIAALPAVIKVVNPLAAAVAGSGGGTGAAASAVPTGMAALRSSHVGAGAGAAARLTGMAVVAAAGAAHSVAKGSVGTPPPPPPAAKGAA